MTTPTLVWTTHKLAEGWVLLCVDANLEQPGEPEALLGFRKAVHPFAFDEMNDPVGEFTAVIAEMTKAVTFGLMAYAPTLPASRACAFVPGPARTASEVVGLMEAARCQIDTPPMFPDSEFLTEFEKSYRAALGGAQ